MPEPKRLLKVFLCHASQDKPSVRELAQRLSAEGWIDPWLDEKKLLPGQDWRLKIEEAVEISDIVIICLSSNSVRKEGFVQKELRHAKDIALEKPEESIFLIPLRIDECDVPRGLGSYQRADYFGEKKDETYNALLESLKLRLEQILKTEKEERARKEKEKHEREAAEQARQERAEREAAEKIAKKTTSHPVQVSEESRSGLNEEKREKTLEQNSIDKSLKETKTSEPLESTGLFEQWKIETTNEAEQSGFHYANVQFNWSSILGALQNLRKKQLESIKKNVEELKEKSDPKYLNDNGDNLPDEHGSLPDLNAWAFDLRKSGIMLQNSLAELRVLWGQINGAWEQLIKETDLDEAELIPLQRQLKAANDVITEITSDLLKSRDQLMTILRIADIDNSKVDSAIRSCHPKVKDAIKEFEYQQLRIEEMSDFFSEINRTISSTQ
jgi:hypothetical protein